MKLYVDTTGNQMTVSKATEPKNDQNGMGVCRTPAGLRMPCRPGRLDGAEEA